ncbi:riboflavin kinase [Pullulanibacillus sp. KACC 23026]|uniref:riboflavin kinase n=1 Tax=Pullulanibacillus sp. KACC 23026 TaxID=3028315 RepID=UPI0023AE9A87|nr:riboflavin kinase [Pullulanibacillus sp. KACC 23026]WEG11047.1 riboflavin kinase [Pullulanibacillus sp. KACC 23026]
MEVIELTPELKGDSESLVAVLGNFDGVHLGHEAILRSAKKLIGEKDHLAIIGFSSAHQESSHSNALTSFSEKLERLENLGVQKYYNSFLPEDGLADTAKKWVLECLAKLSIKQIIVGQSYRVEEMGMSSFKELVDLCRQVNIEVQVVPELTVNGHPIETSKIIRLVEEGKMEAVQTLMGRPFTVAGTVIHGEKLGRELGFPTINLGNVESYVTPKPGVYIGIVGIHDESQGITDYWNTLISSGYRPTVNGKHYLIEAYLLNYSGDLYGKQVSVSFLSYMRGEIKFDGLEPLIEQMKQDKQEAETLFGLNE